MGTTFQFKWEVILIEWCQKNLPDFVIQLLTNVSLVGDTIFIVAILGIVYLCYDKKIGSKIIKNTLISTMVAGCIKNIFKRRRPYFDNENIKCLKIVDKNYDLYDVNKQGFSFPSMHSSNISVMTSSLYRYYRKNSFLIIAILFSAIVGVSRFVLGCHYPTDVIVGWTLGVSSTILIGNLQEKINEKYMYLIGIILGIIGMMYCTTSDFYSFFGIYLGFILCEIYDKKKINFKNTRNIIKSIMRLLLSCAVFLLVSNALKLLIPILNIIENTFASYIFVTFRYFLSTFIGLGLTPIVYKYNILKLDDKFKNGEDNNETNN